MSKKVDWDSMYKGALRGKRGKYASSKELFAKSHEDLNRKEKELNDFRQIEPYLKKALIAHMVQRKPLEVRVPIAYFTDELVKSNSPTDVGRFQSVKKVVEAGETLTFSHIDQAMGLWIFKSSSGEEVEIFDKPIVDLGSGPIQNPGYWGLLVNTHIYPAIKKALAGEEE